MDWSLRLNRLIILLFSTFLFLWFGSSAFAATLSLSPSSSSQILGDIFSVNILLNTQAAPIDGVDIRYLTYPAALLEAQDDDLAAAGIQIIAGALMPQTIINNVDAVNGKIEFSQVINTGGLSFNGSGTLATVRFKALASGTAAVNFNFISGNTTDTNVASAGADVLTSITNGSYPLSSTASACKTSTASWQNTVLSAQNGSFIAEFNAIPNNNLMDGVIGLSLGPSTNYANLATIARFNTSGNIDARNGGVYAAATAIPYALGNSYHFRIVINIPNHTYSIYVTPPSSQEITLGLNYAFRTEQNTVNSLDNWAIYSQTGTHQVCNFTITAIVADTTPPTISSITASSLTTSGATITWTTNESSDSQVEYGTTTAYGSSSVLNSSLVTTHSVTLSGLSAGTTYNYRVKSKDAAGNLATSINFTFATSVIADTTPPSAITNLSSSNIGETSATLTWTAPGDDGTTGTAASYDIRYSTSTITSANWASATQAAGEPAPLAAGVSQSYTLVGLTSSTTYFVAIKTNDEVPNTSGLSNVIQFTTVAPPPPPPPTPTTSSVVLTSPNGGQCFSHGQNVTITWTRSNVDHNALYYTTDGGATVPAFGLWFFMFDSGSTATSYNWTIPSNITSDTVRIWVEGHNTVHTQRLVIDSSDANLSIKSNCAVASPPPSSPTTTSTSSSALALAPSDVTPPSQIQNLVITPGQRQLKLTWKNPSTDPDWVRTVIIKKTGFAPINVLDGVKVFEGAEETFIDLNVEAGKEYHYAVFTLDRIPNYSERVTAKAVPLGVFVSDVTPPLQISSLKANVGDKQIELSWKNPLDQDWVRTIVVRKINSAPISPSDGVIVFEGTGERFLDVNLENNKNYFYSIFTHDKAPNYSERKIISAIPKEGLISFKPVVGAFTFNRNLSFGLRNDSDVKRLQEILAHEGVYSTDDALHTGNFFLLTRQGVIDFQKKHGIVPALGFVGPLTRTKLNELHGEKAALIEITKPVVGAFTFNRNLSFGLRNDSDVKKLQEILALENVYTKDSNFQTGNFFSLTQQAVIDFQKKYGIVPALGFIGPLTRQKLNELYGGSE